MPGLNVFVGAALVFALGALGSASAQTVSYSYDAAGRLTHAFYPDGAIAYVYDAAGNLLQRTVSAGVSPSPIEPTMSALRSGADLQIAYATDACAATDHALFVGALGDFTTAASAECSIGNSGVSTIPLPEGGVWFLVAGVEGNRYSGVGEAFAGSRVLAGIGGLCAGFTNDTTRSCP